jgi:hypothetical protein
MATRFERLQRLRALQMVGVIGVQDRYVGDIGDYIKLAMLRHLSPGRKLGVAWYLYPDESHNADGRHTAYLSDPAVWRHLDPQLFDTLAELIHGERSVRRLSAAGLLVAVFSAEKMRFGDVPARHRDILRSQWFANVMQDLDRCDFVFADPDNGLADDQPHRRSGKKFGKSIPLAEVMRLAQDRAAVIYHHNTRFRGGHDAEIAHWRGHLGTETMAIRANAYSCRTFFVLNPGANMRRLAESFCERWKQHGVSLG